MKRVTPNARHIGGKIAEYRLKNGWSQADLAAQLQLYGCDLTREAVAKMEIGYRTVSVFELDCLVEVFGITYNDLFAK